MGVADGFVITIAVLYTLIVGAGIALMIIHRKKDTVKNRDPFLSVITSAFGIFFAWTNALFFVLTEDQQEDLTLCPLFGFPYSFIPYFYCLPVSIKCITLAWKYRSNMKRLQKETKSRFIRWEWLVSRRVMWLASVFIFLLFVFLTLYNEFFRTPGPATIEACHFNQIRHTNTALIAFLLIWVVLYVFIYSVKDTYYIKYELIALFLCNAPLLIFNMLYRSFNLWGYPDWYGRICIEFMIVLFLGSVIQVIFPVSLYYYEKYYQKSQLQHQGRNDFNLEAYAGARDVLLVVLDIPQLRQSFEKFCVESFCIENLLFYLESQAFKKLRTQQERDEKAKQMKKDFFDSDAANALNVDDAQKKVILSKINGGMVDSDMFNDMTKSVFFVIKRDPFRRWTQSQDFIRAIDEFRRLTSENSSIPKSSSIPFEQHPHSNHDPINIHVMSSLSEPEHSIRLEVQN